MNFYLVTAFTFSIFLPGVAAIFLFRRIEKTYHPFIFCLWIGCLNEVLSFYLVMNGHQSLVNNNIYVLIEALLLTSFFKSAGVITQNTRYLLIVLSILLCWTFENFIFRSIRVNSTYFRIFASLLIVALSLQFIEQILFTSKTIFRNANFILCFCFIIYFSFKALVQSFVIYGSTRDINFLVKIYNILLYINLGVNLLYITAVLWMPRKAKFT